jgi:dTDP-glucose pyrophosphorylase
VEELAKSAPAILVYRIENDDPNDFQAPIETDGEGNWVGITERQQARKGMLVNTGAYCLDKSYFDLPLQKAGNKTEEYGLPQTMLQLNEQGQKIRTVEASWWHKVSAPNDLTI